MAKIVIEVDDKLKTDLDGLFKELGLDTPTAIMIFLKQVEREKRIPFTISLRKYQSFNEFLKNNN